MTLAFLGDSVTQGCFEIYKKEDGRIETVYDKRYSYEMYVLEALTGISGDRAPCGLTRLRLLRNPDTTELPANKINRPTRDMNRLFAYELVRTMFIEK